MTTHHNRIHLAKLVPRTAEIGPPHVMVVVVHAIPILVFIVRVSEVLVQWSATASSEHDLLVVVVSVQGTAVLISTYALGDAHVEAAMVHP
jgi:hypothetical protein